MQLEAEAENMSTKTRPILFSGSMVRAILAGKKTQTRRIMKPQPNHELERLGECEDMLFGGLQNGTMCVWRSPFGNAGDRLWVRESFFVAEPYSYGTDPSGEQLVPHGVQRGPVHYAADGDPENTPNRHYPNGLQGGKFSAPDPNAVWVSRPSIHMPRWASRITLEITDVSVERLKDISNEDCTAEGITAIGNGVRMSDGTYAQAGRYEKKSSTVRQLYSELWESINGVGSWEKNPWVWVISFERVDS